MNTPWRHGIDALEPARLPHITPVRRWPYAAAWTAYRPSVPWKFLPMQHAALQSGGSGMMQRRIHGGIQDWTPEHVVQLAGIILVVQHFHVRKSDSYEAKIKCVYMYSIYNSMTAYNKISTSKNLYTYPHYIVKTHRCVCFPPFKAFLCIRRFIFFYTNVRLCLDYMV